MTEKERKGRTLIPQSDYLFGTRVYYSCSRGERCERASAHARLSSRVYLIDKRDSIVLVAVRDSVNFTDETE